MDIIDSELEKMYKWILESMKPNFWYPIKTDKAYDIINQLFKEGIIDFCEFDETETHFRKIEDELLSEL
jgi:hypothetical protein